MDVNPNEYAAISKIPDGAADSMDIFMLMFLLAAFTGELENLSADDLEDMKRKTEKYVDDMRRIRKEIPDDVRKTDDRA